MKIHYKRMPLSYQDSVHAYPIETDGFVWQDRIKRREKQEVRMVLYRPVGTKELELIEESGYTKYPPRLPEQPIFYPVLNEKYATEIAEKWNVKYNQDHKGFVTRFEIDDEYFQQFEVHIVGGRYHQELWVPAEELDDFNRHIVGKIQVIREFSSEECD